MLPRISEFVRTCQFHPAESIATTWHSNWTYASRRLRKGLGFAPKNSFLSAMDLREFARTYCDVAFSHDGFPQNATDVPVVWQNSIVDPQMAFSYGRDEVELHQEREAKRKLFARASAVLVSTQSEQSRLSRWFPESSSKFVAMPFFLPYLRAISLDDLERKFSRDDILRVLFIGHEAIRKGLDRVFAALALLPMRVQQRIQVKVVSRMNDGRLRIPLFANLSFERELGREDVLQQMREADIYVMPSRFESYGFTFIEALSQGAIPIVPDWEVQREIVDYGRAGVVTSGDPTELARILEQLLDAPQRRQQLARAARHRFEEVFSAATVASQLNALFHRMIGRRDDSEPAKVRAVSRM